MKSQRIAFYAAVSLVMVMPLRPARAGAAEVEAVLRLMPADSPISVVVVDFEKLDKMLGTIVKGIKPDLAKDAEGRVPNDAFRELYSKLENA